MWIFYNNFSSTPTHLFARWSTVCWACHTVRGSFEAPDASCRQVELVDGFFRIRLGRRKHPPGLSNWLLRLWPSSWTFLVVRGNVGPCILCQVIRPRSVYHVQHHSANLSTSRHRGPLTLLSDEPFRTGEPLQRCYSTLANRTYAVEF
jgi:hypothetical protein